MTLSKAIHRGLLALGAIMILGASQCVVVQPPPGGGGGGGAPPANQVIQAEFTRGAQCNARRGSNRGRGFEFRGQCYSCPPGYKKSVFRISGKKGCVRNVVKFRKAEALGRPGCKARGEFTFRNNCYRCPRGYRRGNGAQCVSRS